MGVKNPDNDSMNHQYDGEQFKITHKLALLSQISRFRDFYEIGGSSPSVEEPTAYRFMTVSLIILTNYHKIDKL